MLNTLIRIVHISLILLRYGIDGEIPIKRLPWYIRPFAYLLPGRYLFKHSSRSTRIRRALEKLGPVFVKFGQLLSTRPDLIPDDIFNELSKLQDNVPAFDSQIAINILNNAYQQPLHQLFANIEKAPLASASIAQVHGATLHDGKKVVLKIVRPNIESVIRRDLKCMRLIATLIHALHKDGKRLHPVAIVDDYQFILLTELDLQHEAGNTALLREHFKHSNDLYVPEVHWDYCKKNILCLERIQGIPVGDIEQLQQAGVDFDVLSKRAVRIFFTQLLENNFFHADMHPGNIFVDASNPKDPSFIALDCAIIGSLEHSERLTIARLLDAVFSRDYQQAAEIMINKKWVSPETHTGELAGAIRASNEAVFAKPIAEISFANQLLLLFATGRRFNMQVQPSLFLLQKTLFNIEGLGKQLNPDLDLWGTAQPFIKHWIKKYYSPLGILKRNAQYLPQWLDEAPQIIDSLLNNPPDKAQSPQPQASNRSSKIVALLATGTLGLAIVINPNWIQHTPNGIWLLSGVMLSWLWLR